jgi:hypothetical protein
MGDASLEPLPADREQSREGRRARGEPAAPIRGDGAGEPRPGAKKSAKKQIPEERPGRGKASKELHELQTGVCVPSRTPGHRARAFGRRGHSGTQDVAPRTAVPERVEAQRALVSCGKGLDEVARDVAFRPGEPEGEATWHRALARNHACQRPCPFLSLRPKGVAFQEQS